MKRLTYLLTLFAAALLLAAPAQAQQRVALLIGNAAYPVGRLSNPPQDLKEMEAALREVGFKVQVVRDAGQAQMKRAVRDFGEMAQGADVALLYYSGHGTQALGENYLIPVDASIRKESDYDVEAVSANAVMRQILVARPRAAIVVLDACRDNPHAAFTRSGTKGLSRMDAPTGSMIAFATAPGTTASDEGLYARALAANIRKKGLELVDVFRDTAAEVRRLSSNRQDPRVSEMSINERIYLAGRDEGQRPTAGPPTALDVAGMPSGPTRPIPSLLQPYQKDMRAASACLGETRNPVDVAMQLTGKMATKGSENTPLESHTNILSQSPGLRLHKSVGTDAISRNQQAIGSLAGVMWTVLKDPADGTGFEISKTSSQIECSGPLMPLSVGKKVQLKYVSTHISQWPNQPRSRLVVAETIDIAVNEGPWTMGEAVRRYPQLRVNGASSAQWKAYEVRVTQLTVPRDVPAEQRDLHQPKTRTAKHLFVEGPNVLVQVENEGLMPGWTLALTEITTR